MGRNHLEKIIFWDIIFMIYIVCLDGKVSEIIMKAFSKKLAAAVLSLVVALTMSFPGITFGAVQTRPSAPKTISASVSGNVVTLSWSKIKGADKYKVYRRTTKTVWNYLKTVKRTSANRKKYSDTSKYKLKKYNKKYKVYKKGTKKVYTRLITTKRLTYKFTGKYNKSYTFVIKTIRNKRISPYSKAKTVRTEKKAPAADPEPSDEPGPEPEPPAEPEPQEDPVRIYDPDSKAVLLNSLEDNDLNTCDLAGSIPEEHKGEQVEYVILDEPPMGHITGSVYRSDGFAKRTDASGNQYIADTDNVEIRGEGWKKTVAIRTIAWFVHRVLPYANNENRVSAAGNYIDGVEVKNALEVAKQAGAYGVEIDIWKTKDGKFVVNHDAKFTRNYGVKSYVCRKTWSKIKNTPALSGVPTLTKMLKQCAAKGLAVSIEFKQLSVDNTYHDLAYIGTAADAEALNTIIRNSGIDPDKVVFFGISRAEVDEKGNIRYGDDGYLITGRNSSGTAYPDKARPVIDLLRTGNFHHKVTATAQDVVTQKTLGTAYFDESYPNFFRTRPEAYGFANCPCYDFQPVTVDNIFIGSKAKIKNSADHKKIAHVRVDDGIMTVEVTDETVPLVTSPES